MITLLIDQLFISINEESLLNTLQDELPNPGALDGFVEPGNRATRVRVYGPEIVTHFLGGVHPALPTIPLLLALLCKAASLAKVSSHEPVFTSLFAQSLAEVDPRMASCILPLWWQGGDSSIEADLLEASESVVAMGDDSTIESIRQRLRSGASFIPFGNSFSLGLVARESLTVELCKETAIAAAFDVALADQLSCLSPQVIYVEKGGRTSPREFARVLADELDAWEIRLPLGVIPSERAIALDRFRHRYEFRGYSDPKSSELYANGPSLPKRVVVYDEADKEIRGTPGYRTIRICPLDDLFELVEKIHPFTAAISCVGVSANDARFNQIVDKLAAIGVTRLCPLGKMGTPPLSWHRSGRRNLSPFLRWVDVELPT
jgi:hypothetical protein